MSLLAFAGLLLVCILIVAASLIARSQPYETGEVGVPSDVQTSQPAPDFEKTP